MDSSRILGIILVTVLCGVPLILAQHVYVRAYHHHLGLLYRYALGTGTICLCLSLAALLQGAYLWALAPWLVAGIIGGTTGVAYLVTDRREAERTRRQEADRAELEARRAVE